jgi:glycerol-3-phosphate O-acyltransferase
MSRFLARPDLAGQPTEYQAAILRSDLLAQISRHRQMITGPVLKSREELNHRVLDSERFQKFMQSHAELQQMPFAAVRDAAEKCLREISADLRPNWIRFYSAIVGWILKTLFEGVAMNREGLSTIKRMAMRGAIVYIPSHKSHVDYLLLSYMLYRHGLPCPLIAAGKNLAFWPMGPLFRRGGAFFIRRSFRGAVLYSRVFAEYVHTLLEEGYSVEQFIEGGRSRTGKLLLPKLGLLSILLTAQKNSACEDLIFVPISIGYDRVPEETSYLQEIEGGQKQPENIWQVIKARKFLKCRHGRVYLQFNAPLSINDLTHSLGVSLKALPPKDFNAFCRSVGHRIAHAINQVSVVTPQALVAAAILNSGRDRFELENTIDILEIYLAHLESVGAKLADTLILDHRRAAFHALQSYEQRNILEALEPPAAGNDSTTGFILRDAKRPLLNYYQNTCVIFFIPAAFTALAILQRDAFQFSASDLHADVEFLNRLFKNEFVLDPDTTAEHILRQSLQRFYEDAALVPHPELPDTFNVTSAGFRKLKLFAMFLRAFLESYEVVLAYLRQASQEPEDGKERIKKIAALGNRMLKNKEIETKEALSKVTYENAVEFFMNQGIKGPENRETIEHFAAAIARALRSLTR